MALLLRIVREQSPAKVEEELRLLVSRPEELLQVPVRPKVWWLGGEAALMQLVITWARRAENATLVTYVGVDEDPDPQLKAMSRRLFGFTSLLMAVEVVDRSGSRSVRPQAFDRCREVAEMMMRPVHDFALGSKVFLVCVDHSTKWRIPWLYSPGAGRIVRDRVQFVTLTREMVRRASMSSDDLPIPADSYARFGAILHELFKNTEDWATADGEGRPWRRSVRGIAAERHSLTPAERSSVTAQNPVLARFLEAGAADSPDDRARFFEFTVFDSGLGLAKQWLRHRNGWWPDIPLEDELTACLECLKKHSTSSSRREKGLGLAEVMRTLGALGAFLKIRTGRLALYRDFLHEPLRQGEEDVRLFDLPSGSERPTPLAPVFGTSYQIIIPAAGRAG